MEQGNELVGKVLGTVTFPIEAGKVREFAKSIQDPNPIFRDAAAAAKAGFSAIPAPPTYTVVAAHFQEGDSTFSALGLDLARVLHGEQQWIFHRTPVVGDVLTGETKVVSVEQKPGARGGVMTFVKLGTEYVDQNGQPVVTEESTVIETAAVVGGGGE
jgi:acyl dehydratase